MRLLLVAAVAIAASLPVMAMDGYVFVAPGALKAGGFTNGSLHFGGGAEHVFASGIGVGAEIGAFGSWSNFNPIGIFSLNGSYHFARDRQKVDPFVTGGYSLGFRSATINMVNFGGGLNYWFSPRFGARFEFRDHIHSPGRAPNFHYLGARFGLAFR